MEKAKKHNIITDIPQFFFWCAYLIELTIVLIDKSALTNPFEGKLFRISFLLCVLAIISAKYNFKELILMVIAGVVAVISYKVTGRNELIRIAAFVIAAKNVNRELVLKFTFWVTLTGMFLVALLAQFGILGRVYLDAQYSFYDDVHRRYCFGMGHPNAFHCMLFMLVLLLIYVYWDRLKWYFGIIGMFLNYVFFIFTESRTGMMLVMLAFVVFMLFKLVPGLKDYLLTYVMVAVSIVGALIVSIIGTICFSWYSPFWVKINDMLTWRLLASQSDGGPGTWFLFGNSNNIEYFDMGYIRMLYWYGWIPTVLCILVGILLCVLCYKKRDIRVLVMLFCLAVYTIAEAHIVSVYIARNYLFVIVGTSLPELFGIAGGNEKSFLQFLFRKGLLNNESCKSEE